MSGSLDDRVLRRHLDDLEHTDWGPPIFGSYLVTRCHALRKKPLKDFTAEDLRLMIGQSVSLGYLVPLALDRLEADPLCAGECHAGDLLVAVLSAGTTDRRVRRRIGEVAEAVEPRLAELTKVERKAVTEALAKFRAG